MFAVYTPLSNEVQIINDYESNFNRKSLGTNLLQASVREYSSGVIGTTFHESYFDLNGVTTQITIYNEVIKNYTFHKKSYAITPTCAPDLSPDSNGICKQPTTCSWATNPPYLSGGHVEAQCTNKKDDIPNLSTGYASDQRWCSADSTCYAIPYYCPMGKYFWLGQCINPDTRPDGRCPAGYYTHNGMDAEGDCWTEKVCKSNPAQKTRWSVSCGSGPVFPNTPDLPNAPDPDSVPSSSPYKDGVSACRAKTELADTMCIAPNIFKSSCNPATGEITSSSCTPPAVAPTKDVAPEDITKGATSEDIKSLSNDLPKNIKTSLEDFFSDGSTPYLSSIKGFLEASTILHADANDKLSQIEGNGQGSLILQADTNDKLDRVKSSVDQVDGTLTSVKNALEGGTGLSSSDMINASDLIPDGTVVSAIEGLGSDVASIKTQFDNLKAVVTGDFVPPAFASGSCTSISINFLGTPITANFSRISSILSPYAPVTSMMVYIMLMIMTFRSVFKFFSRGI